MRPNILYNSCKILKKLMILEGGRVPNQSRDLK
jgi:hypothetical protein